MGNCGVNRHPNPNQTGELITEGMIRVAKKWLELSKTGKTTQTLIQWLMELKSWCELFQEIPTEALGFRAIKESMTDQDWNSWLNEYCEAPGFREWCERKYNLNP